MRAMVLEAPGRPLVAVDLPRPEPADGQVLLRVRACGVCPTDLHLLDGEGDVPPPPPVPRHPIVREVVEGARPVDPAARGGGPWAGPAVRAAASTVAPPEPLDASLIFAPVGPLVTTALGVTDRGGVVVCAGIHMSDIPSFPYELLWEERVVRSVANLTREDGREFLAVAPQVPVHTEVTMYPLERANDALEDLRAGRFRGAAVIVPPGSAA